MNVKGRKNTIQKHLEISADGNEILKNLTKSLNDELDCKYYEWQIFEASIRIFEKQLKLMDTDRKLEIMDVPVE